MYAHSSTFQWVRYALRETWNLNSDDDDGAIWYFRGNNVKGLFSEQYRKLPKSLRKRLKYYRSIVQAAGTEDVLLYGASQATSRDGQKAWYADTLVQELVDGQTPGQNPLYTHTVVQAKYGEVLDELRAIVQRTKISVNEGSTGDLRQENQLIPPGSHLYCAADHNHVVLSPPEKQRGDRKSEQ
jgi:hypothetical protein